MNIYIASLGNHVGKIKEDIYIRDMYISRGFSAEIVELKALGDLVDLGDVVIFKSIWGYHLETETLLKTLTELEDKGVHVINRLDIVRWNINKLIYINEISPLIPVIPTVSLDTQKENSFTEIENRIKSACTLFNSEKVVIKPTISASGYLTNIFKVTEDNESIIESIIQNSLKKYIIQPYRESVREGEISVVILRGEMLYGILRTPGLFSEKRPPIFIPLSKVPQKIFDSIEILMRFFIKKFGSAPDMCRVDFLEEKTEYEILEIELIDPDLYFKYLEPDLREKVLSMFIEML